MINVKALRVRLVLSYGVILLLFALLLCTGVFLLVRGYLTRTLIERQAARIVQIQSILQGWYPDPSQTLLINEIERTFAPQANGRFIRIFSKDGLLYSSEQVGISPPGPDSNSITWLKTDDGRKLLTLTTHVSVHTERYTIQSGVATDQLEQVLTKLLLFMLLGSLSVVIVAALGGNTIVRQALYPVVEMAGEAEKISVENLSQRLPNPNTGDELESLAFSLNRLLHRLEQSLQYSQRFVADASHELRTPLTILQGEMELLLQGKVPPDAMDRVIGNLLEETERLTRIVETLLTLSELDMGDGQREFREINLGELASTTSEQMALLAEEKKITVSSQILASVKVVGDYARLKQVVVNLLDNAIKYTPPGGQITMKVAMENQRGILEVSDTGIGIPADAVPRIFDRFFRADKSRSRTLGGAGLGLAIVKAICDAHQATIAVKSQPGEGSRFRLEFLL